MYSIVVLTALTAAPDGPQFNGYFRDLFTPNSCGGCNGCSGAARYSCGGCSGCNGCCGGSVFGLGLGERVRSFFDRDPIGYGCCGGRSYSCFGASYSCSGCCGSAYSCFGGSAMSYTPTTSAGLSCQGGIYAVPQPAFDPFPPAPGANVAPAPGAPNIPYALPDSAPGVGLRPAAAPTGGALAGNTPSARATVIVRLPADARLAADGRTLNLTGAERTFVSPDLPRGQEFVYKFTAEYERDGETVSVSKKVAVRAGLTASVTFADLTAARGGDAPGTTTAAPAKGAAPTGEPAKARPAPPADAPAGPGDRATITVKLPADATLYVDDRKSPSKEPVRSFATPPLPNGREFAYVIKAEVVRNGQPETVTQKVPFRAGERVVVDFSSLGK